MPTGSSLLFAHQFTLVPSRSVTKIVNSNGPKLPSIYLVVLLSFFAYD